MNDRYQPNMLFVNLIIALVDNQSELFEYSFGKW